MANHQSALKRIRRDTKRRRINLNRLNRVRTFIKKLQAHISKGDKAAAQTEFKTVQAEVMRGASKGVMHKNTASRRIARLNAQIKAM